MKQNYTSAATSINSTKLPRIYNSFGIRGNIFDYGCGRFTDHLKEAVRAAGFEWWGMDKFNQSPEFNQRSMMEAHDVSYVFCSNVLNVIDSNEVVAEVVANLHHIAAMHDAAVVVTIYEGDRSGIGRVTKADCFQRNEVLRDYLPYFEGFASVKLERGCIVARV